MKSILFSIAFVGCISIGFAQSISLDPNSLQLPRVAANPACAVADKGKLIYNTTQNKVLFCNGSAWVDPSTAAAPSNWVNSGNNAVLLNGRVGIGTEAPTTTLDINGNLRVRGNFPVKGSTLVSIDNNGTLNWQKPYAFRAEGLEGEANMTVGANQTVQLMFTYPDYNIGQMYSVNSGKFTAPVRGIYHIETHVASYKKTQGPNSGYAPYVSLVRKRIGDPVNRTIQYTKFGIYTEDGSDIFGPTVHHTISGDFMLEVGDVLWIDLNAEIVAQLIDGGKNQISFSGRLVMQIF
ncbi:C1q-like domain-containing protein [Emticicia sp. BO119]|uniref:C1q-like domain-containing protein n=1 Tax=Emticicia sp. BO119 TaxID=2757768 RepID=UPI0015F0A133|nr:hypothetical protein [Emticicia sp. BO119]MBA4851468.1 hypothetical protein [Emticicia sp. BO119]